MKNLIVIIGLLVMLAFSACTGSGTLHEEGRGGDRVAQPSDTLYTQEAAMDVYASDPDRALLIIDSAEIVGNLSAVDADVLRAKVYSWSCEEMNYDSAILIGERLMQQEKVKESPGLQEDVLEILLNSCRLRKDYEQALHWATVLGGLYLSRRESSLRAQRGKSKIRRSQSRDAVSGLLRRSSSQ